MINIEVLRKVLKQNVKIKQKIIKYIGFVLLLVLLSGCSDTADKVSNYSNKMRIEYSLCTACGDCTEQFNCPENAIKIDSLTLTRYIDADLCIGCMECINQFQCPDNAFTSLNDTRPPAKIADIEAISDSIGKLEITFTAVGDDSLAGRAYRYELTFKDSNNSFIPVDFEPPLPLRSGNIENWHIYGLPQNVDISLELEVMDEENNKSVNSKSNLEIMGEDIIAPAKITDLQVIADYEYIELNWTATGDDGEIGIADYYEIRKSEEVINDINWSQAQLLPNLPVPDSAGTMQSLILSDLNPETQYYFGIKAFDDNDNASELSNIVNASLLADTSPPDQIDDLTVVSGSVSNNSFQLSWTAVGDDGLIGIADSYIIKVHTEVIDSENWDSIEAYPQNIIPQETGETEVLNINNLEPLTHYYAAIKAVDEANNLSLISNTVNTTTSAIPDTIPPAAITDLSAESTETNILLTWTAPGDDENQGTADYYQIKIAETAINENNWENAELLSDIPFPQPAGSIQQYNVQNLNPGITYFFAIKTWDENNNISALSNVISANLLEDLTPPASISDLTATGLEEQILLEWTAPGDDENQGTAAYYEIRVSEAQIDATNWDNADLLPNLPTPQSAGTNEQYLAENLMQDIVYYFGIKTFDDNNNASELSNIVNASIVADTTPPANIDDLEVLAGNAINLSTIEIEWTAPGDDGQEGTALNYEIRFHTEPIDESNWETAVLFENPPTPEPSGTTQNCQINGLQEATVYYFAIKAYDDNGNVNDASNSPGGKIVYQIDTDACHNCNNCIYDCDYDAIHQGYGYKYIDPDECEACGDCSCPWGLIYRAVVAY